MPNQFDNCYDYINESQKVTEAEDTKKLDENKSQEDTEVKESDEKVSEEVVDEKKEDEVKESAVILQIKEGVVSIVSSPPGVAVSLLDYDAKLEESAEKDHKVIVLSDGKIPDWENPDEEKMINDLMESKDDNKEEEIVEESKEKEEIKEE